MKNSPEKVILEQAKRFDAQALEEIFDQYSPGIYRYAYRLLGDTELARECMAETFSRFLTALKRESGPDNYLQAYLYRIAHNWITDYYRRKVPPILPLDKVNLTDSTAEPHQAMVDHLSGQQLRDALSLLTPDQRQVLVLKYIEEWENKAISLALNRSVGAIKGLQHRGLEALRRILNRNKDFDV